MLTGVESFHVASGGYGNSQGAVTPVSEGEAEVVKKAIQLIEAIKGEPSLEVKRGICATFAPIPPGQPRTCQYQGQSQEALPLFLRNR